MLRKILKEKNKTKIILEDAHGFDLAEEFKTLNREEKNSLFWLVEDDDISKLLMYLTAEEAARELKNLDSEKAASILKYIPSDDKVDILSEMDFKARKSILSLLEDGDKIKGFLLYKDNQNGAYTNYEIIKVNPEMDVKEATKKLIKEAPNLESISTLFVVDGDNNYLGIVPFKTLIRTRSPHKIFDITEELTPALITGDIEITATKITHYKIYEMPVVDSDNKLLGMITSDDVLDVKTEEAKEDIEKLAAISNSSETKIFKSAFHRAPWLILLVLLSIPIALLTKSFAKQLAGIAILILFQPLILGTPGNIATQTLAVTLSELNEKGKINVKHFFKEFFSGFLIAITLAALTFIFSFLFMIIKPVQAGPGIVLSDSSYINGLVFATIISASIFIVVLIAPVIALLVPATLKLCKVDPAVASGPFITTLIDVISVIIYFTLAFVLLKSVGVLVL